MAEDSGLCVDSLNDAPGVYSARYAGNHNDQASRDKLLKELKGKDKLVYFICNIILYYPNGEYKSFVGKTDSKITEEEKNSVSHRSRALQEMLKNICLF